MDASAIVSSRTGQKVNYQGGAVPLRSEFGVLLLLAIIWIVICALLEPIGEFPLNDNWVYALAV
jgi:hypothetical protein